MMGSFDGFSPEDFGEVAGTTWRRRESLGGHLSDWLSKRFHPPFQSWAVYGRPELHLARKEAYDFDDPYPYAKLFIQANPNDVLCGFYVEAVVKDGKPDIGFSHWRQFRDRLQQDAKMRDAALKAFHELDLFAGHCNADDGCGNFGRKFKSKGGSLYQASPDRVRWRSATFDEFCESFAKLPRSKWIDFWIYQRIPKAEAIAMKADVVNRLHLIFNAVAPIYMQTIALR